MAIIRVSGTCDSGSTPDRTTPYFFAGIFLVMIFKHFVVGLTVLFTKMNIKTPDFRINYITAKNNKHITYTT